MTSERESSESAESGHGAQPDHCLHLPSLGIAGFRGIKKLSIPRLGRVTLLAGKNGVGKTTVLDAVTSLCVPSPSDCSVRAVDEPRRDHRPDGR